MRIGDCVKHAEIDLSPEEKRGRYLAAEAAHAETQELELDAHEDDGLAAILCGASLALSALAVLLFGMALGHQILLPSATVWPLCVAAGLCTAIAAVTGKVGLTRL
jgi:hypothetical protein